MESSHNLADKIKDLYKKKEGREISDHEAQEASNKLVGLVSLLFDMAQEDARKKRRLKQKPDGFPVDGNYSCLICSRSIDKTNGWYDWYGQTCLVCRKALKESVVPYFVCTNRNSYFSMSSLNYRFDIKHQTTKKYISEGKLIPRIILDENNKPYEYIFLRKENPCLVYKDCPEKKSWNRNRDKVTKRLIRKEKMEIRKIKYKNKK